MPTNSDAAGVRPRILIHTYQVTGFCLGYLSCLRRTIQVTPLVKKAGTLNCGKPYLVGLSSPSDLAVVANGARVKGKERVTLDIGWHGRGGRCVHLHHLFMLLEDDPNDVVDEIVGQLGVRDSKIVKADRVIFAKQGGICSGGHT